MGKTKFIPSGNVEEAIDRGSKQTSKLMWIGIGVAIALGVVALVFQIMK